MGLGSTVAVGTGNAVAVGTGNAVAVGIGNAVAVYNSGRSVAVGVRVMVGVELGVLVSVVVAVALGSGVREAAVVAVGVRVWVALAVGTAARAMRASSNRSETPAMGESLSALLTIPEKRTLSLTASPSAAALLTRITISGLLKTTSGGSRSIDISVFPDLALILDTHPYHPSTFLETISSLYCFHRGAIRANEITVGMGVVGMGVAVTVGVSVDCTCGGGKKTALKTLHAVSQKSMQLNRGPRHPRAPHMPGFRSSSAANLLGLVFAVAIVPAAGIVRTGTPVTRACVGGFFLGSEHSADCGEPDERRNRFDCTGSAAAHQHLFL